MRQLANKPRPWPAISRSANLPNKKLTSPRKRVGVYIEEALIIRFKTHYEKFGDFSNLLNDLLAAKLNELDNLNHQSQRYEEF